MPLGQLKSNFNYSLDDKRVLNFENVVNDDDNIKQVGVCGWWVGKWGEGGGGGGEGHARKGPRLHTMQE